jgi:hypothetical protein
MKKSLIIRTGILNFIMCFALLAAAGWSNQKVAASPTLRIYGAAEREIQLKPDLGKLPPEPVKDQLVQSESMPVTPMTIGSPIGVNLLISQSSAGVLGHPGSAGASISADGKRVAFFSPVGNLVPGDNNATDDVFIRDWESGQTKRISVSSAGAQGNGRSWWSEISDNGRFVVFSSEATNLVLTDTNTVRDIFLRDLVTDSTVRVSTSFTGTQANNLSVYGSVSADGKMVAFSSLASNLVSGDTNVKQDIFVKNMETGALKRISVNNSGTQGNGDSQNPSISGDGNFVAFESTASNLVDNDANGNLDVFVYDLQTDTIQCASVRYTDGLPSNSASYLGLSRAMSNLSFDGSAVAFISYSSNLVSGDTNGKIDAFVRDLELDYTERVSVSSTDVQGDQVSDQVTISSDGQVVAFASLASTLESGDTNSVYDIYLHELSNGDTHLVSLSNEGKLGDYSSTSSALSADGRYLVYHTGATNLLGGGVSSYGQVLLFDPLGIDLQIDSVKPVQVLEDEDLVVGKSTAIKAVIRKLGAQPLSGISVSANYNGQTTYIFYVDEPNNSDVYGFLKQNNNGHMLSFATNEITKTVYLVGDELTPDELLSYSVEVEVDPLVGFDEVSESNNHKTATAFAIDMSWGIFSNLELAFFPLDWPSFDAEVYSTYVTRSSDFLQGVYPVAEERYKMYQWNDVRSTASYKDKYGKIGHVSLMFWVRWNHLKLKLANPTIDRFVAVVPWGWFDQVYNHPGLAGITFAFTGLSIAEVRWSEDLSTYNIAAHEVGHDYGLWISGLEEYNLADPGYPAPAGFWVSRRMPVDINPIYFCFMSAREDPQDYGFWVDRSDYHKLEIGAGTNAPGFNPPADARAILAAGTVDITGTATLDDWYVLPEAEYAAMPEGEYTFVYLDAGSAVLGEHKVDFWVEGSDWEVLPFSVVIPYLDGTARIELRKGAATLAQKIVSTNAPTVQINAPAGGESYFAEVPITWTGSDLDGDPLSYAVLYSSDGGTTWTTADMNFQEQDYTLNLIGLPPGDNYLVRVIATDGVNTGEDVSDVPFKVSNAVFLPTICKP